MIRSVVFATGHVTSHCIPQSLKPAIVTSVHSQPASQTIVCDESICRVVPGQHPTASCAMHYTLRNAIYQMSGYTNISGYSEEGTQRNKMLLLHNVQLNADLLIVAKSSITLNAFIRNATPDRKQQGLFSCIQAEG